MMVFVPVRRDAAGPDQPDAGPEGGWRGYAATPALSAAHGFDASTEEDANFQAQTYAMISGLVDGLWPDGSRVVLAADVPPAQFVETGDDAELGAVGVSGLTWSLVRAVFSDGAEPDAETTALVRTAGSSVGGSSVQAAAQTEEVQRLVDEADLLWHVPDEPW